MRTTCKLLTAAALMIAVHTTAVAQSDSAAFDVHLPGAGRSTISAFSGIPFPIAAEFSHGISDDFTISAVAGLTWTKVWGLGIRPRWSIATLSDELRIDGSSLMLFYPESHVGEAWALVWPTAMIRWNSGDLQLSAGAGMVATGCTDAIFGIGNHADGADHDHHQGMNHSEMEHQQMAEAEEHENALMGGISATMQFEASYRISADLALRADLYGILADPPIVGNRWPGQVPYVVQLGITYRLP